jgi:F0F1-type ATP synthase membrane subunit b/b'
MFLVQLIIFQIIIFAALIFALRHILTKNITSATSHLEGLNAEFIRREEELKKRQAEAEKLYEDALNKAKNEIDALRLEADRQIKDERDRILLAAQNESEQVITKAEKTKEMMRSELRREVEAGMVANIQKMMAEVLPQRAQKELHRIWVEDLLGGDLLKLKSMRIPEDIRDAKFKSAFLLSEAELAQFKKKFHEILGRDFSFHQEADAALVAGVLITVGDLVLDGTLVNKIEQVVHESA